MKPSVSYLPRDLILLISEPRTQLVTPNQFT